MFEFPGQIHRAIYTTNAIESVNSVIGKFTRNRKQYSDEERVEVDLPGNQRGVQEVDDADRGLEAGIESLRHSL